MADRANAIFGGVLAKETWTLSQAFFVGVVDPDVFQIEVVAGAPIDAVDIAGRG